MSDVHGIIVEEGTELKAYPFIEPIQDDQITWRGKLFSRPEQAAEWMELVDERDRQVGVQLELVRDLHPRYWEWLHRFSNVSFTESGDARIWFIRSEAPAHETGPYLPVEAFISDGGEFILYVPELLRAY